MAYSKLSVTIRPYSDASFILYGEDTKEIKDEIGEHGGRWNPHLKHPLYPGQKIKAYIVANKRKQEMLDFLNSKQVLITEIGGDGKAATPKKERVVDPNRKKTDRYTGKRAMIRPYNDHYIIIYGELNEDMEEDLKELGFEKSNTLKHPFSQKGITGMRGKKIKRASLLDFCIMQDIDYTELTDEQEDIF
jgi:hypothetical protein